MKMERMYCWLPRSKRGRLLLGVVLIPPLLYLSLLGGTRVYVSAGGFGADKFFDKSGGSPGHALWNAIERAGQWWIPTPAAIRVERVGVLHAAWNAIFLICSTALMLLLVPVFLVYGILFTVWGLFTADWGSFGSGLACLVAAPIFLLMVVIFSFLIWLLLLIQPCTPAYAVLWTILGLPFIVLGTYIGSLPSVCFVTVFYPPLALTFKV